MVCCAANDPVKIRRYWCNVSQNTYSFRITAASTSIWRVAQSPLAVGRWRRPRRPTVRRHCEHFTRTVSHHSWSTANLTLTLTVIHNTNTSLIGFGVVHYASSLPEIEEIMFRLTFLETVRKKHRTLQEKKLIMRMWMCLERCNSIWDNRRHFGDLRKKRRGV